MIDVKKIISEALEAGFSQAGELNCEALEFMPEVRDMCAADRCHHYATNWACPPGCGSIEDAAKRASLYSSGFIVQTIGKMEDDFDWDSIQETGAKHNETFKALQPICESVTRIFCQWAAGLAQFAPSAPTPTHLAVSPTLLSLQWKHTVFL